MNVPEIPETGSVPDPRPGLSLIVTAFRVGPFIEQALDSAAGVMEPGDELIVVDDASDDDTPARILRWGESGRLHPGATFRPILFGSRTPGGVGPAANVGLDLARGRIVAFLDGDDWIDAEGFRAVRRAFEAARRDGTGPDIAIANYREWDEAAGAPREPADTFRWAGAEGLTGGAARDRALDMIAVPWRKLYAGEFLDRHGLRFPEGPWFYEDNPFHWAVCLAADGILFVDRIVCHHRIARAGQTMAARGDELLAFFAHHRTIRDLTSRKALFGRRDTLPDGQARAALWLVRNLAWHVPRLAPGTVEAWCASAAEVLRRLPRRVWQETILPDIAIDPALTELFGLLRRGRTAEAAARIASARAEALEERLAGMSRRLDRLESDRTAPPAAPSRPEEIVARYAAARAALAGDG